MDQDLAASFLARTKVLKTPKRVLSTFGATRINYRIVSPIDDSGRRARLRSGHMTSAKPVILTPEALRERFQGFGPEERPFMDWIASRYGESLRGLEYVFKNSDFKARVLGLDPLALAERIKTDFESRESADGALILCPDAGWALALMKFSIDEALRSFPTHVRDLDRRGLLGGPEREEARRREIESLFERASGDRSLLETLGGKLKSYGLFEEYEDRFLSLFK